MNWTSVKLRDVGVWYGGGTPSKANPRFWVDGDLPWLTPKDMGPEVLTSTKDRVTAVAVEESSTKLVPPGSVAIVVRSGILVRTLPVAHVPFATTMNQDMKAVVPREGIDPRWIAWALRAFEHDLLRDARKAGTTVASIEMSRFYDFSIPLPPLDDQRRIVTRLEDLLSRLETANAAVALSLRRLTVARELTLAQTLERALRDDRTSVATIGQLGKVRSGLTPLRSNKAFYEGGTVPWVTSADLHRGLITHVSQHVTERALRETGLRVIPAGSLLVAMYGEGKTRGTAAELAIDATTNQACAAITLHDSSLKAWVRLVLDANYARLRHLAAGGVQPNLNLSIIRAIEVPIPGTRRMSSLMEEQEHWAEAIRRVKRASNLVQHRSKALRRSLLTAAFSGGPDRNPSDMSPAGNVVTA